MNDIITNGTEIKQRIISEVNYSKQVVYLAMAFFTDRDIANAIIGAKSRNVTVDIILSSSAQNETVKQMFREANINVHAFDTGDERGMMHHKFCLIDNKITINGSYNYSYNASNNNVENIHVSDDTSTYSQFLSEFERLKYNIDNQIAVNITSQIPTEKEITIEHLVSAITFYYSKFSKYNSPFDDAMNLQANASESVQQGFNTFMGKAECATCHFAPQFNGVKPPYVGSEFEVIGVPKDIKYTGISEDKGRYNINPATETLNAFRTGTIRNAEKTKPYMHNGVFNTMDQVIDFYNTGGGVGNGLKINNQTLSSDSLYLSANEKINLIVFINSLTEQIPFENAPKKLPKSNNKILNKRKIGGTY